MSGQYRAQKAHPTSPPTIAAHTTDTLPHTLYICHTPPPSALPPQPLVGRNAVCKQCNDCAIAALLLSLTLVGPTLAVCSAGHAYHWLRIGCLCVWVRVNALLAQHCWQRRCVAVAVAACIFIREQAASSVSIVFAIVFVFVFVLVLVLVYAVYACACAYFALSAFLGVRVFKRKIFFPFLSTFLPENLLLLQLKSCFSVLLRVCVSVSVPGSASSAVNCLIRALLALITLK